jgi:hypothetical protein
LGIDGPANLRAEPNGKIIESLPDLSTVWTDYPWKTQGGWFQIRFARLGLKSPIRCANPGDRVNTGWIHVKNIKNDFLTELKGPLHTAMGLTDEVKFDWKSSRERYSAKLKTTCICSQVDEEYHDAPSLEQHEYLSEEQLAGECVINKRFMACELPETAHSLITVCPLACLESKRLEKLTSEDRKKKLSEVAKPLQAKLRAKLGEPFIAALEAKYPNWLPLVIPHPKRNNEFYFDVQAISSWGRFPFTYQKEKRVRALLIFFPNLDEAVAQKPAVAFEGNDGHVEFRSIPFSLRPTKKDGKDEAPPFFCIGSSGDLTALKACRVQNEITPEVGYGEKPPARNLIDFRTDPVKRLPFGRFIDLDETPCCESPSGKILKFESFE